MKPISLERYYSLRFPNYELAAHIKLMIAFLERLEPGDFAIINMPPRHGKTELIRAFTEHWIGQHPDAEVLTASYGASLANRTSRRIRNEIAFGSAFGKVFPNVKLASDSKSVQQWNLEAGGGLRAAGVGGAITGTGADLAVIDDPIKGRKYAESPVVRASTLDWLKADFLTRLSPTAIVVLIQTRWHTNDPAGWALEQSQKNTEDDVEGNALGNMRVKTLILPAIAVDDPDQPDPLGRESGEALWERRWSAKKLGNNKKILGDYEFSALYQQTPVVRGGSIFIGEPARFVTPNLEGARLIIYVDTASSKKTSADHTAITVMAVRGTRENWTGDVLEVIRRRLTITELVPVMQDVRKRHQCTIAFELTAQSLPIIQHLEDKGFVIRKDVPDGDKFSRAVPYAAAFNNGSIRVPANAPWVSNWLSEHHAFTGLDGDTDDQVDSGGGAWRLLTRKQSTQQDYA